MARHVLNGRQIKNAVSLARSFAVSQGGGLGKAHLQTALDAMSAFEADFVRYQPDEEEGTAESDKKRRRM